MGLCATSVVRIALGAQMEEQFSQPVVANTTTGSIDDRAAPRVTLLIRPAKLTGPSGQFMCVLRDLSETGISVRFFHNCPPDERMELELETGDRHLLERVWARKLEAGFQFTAPIDMARTINESGIHPKRQLRLDLQILARIACQGRSSEALVRNISQQGARVECASDLAVAQAVRLQAEGLPEVVAKVRWRIKDQYGLIFDDRFTLGQFAQLAAMRQMPSLVVDPNPAG